MENSMCTQFRWRKTLYVVNANVIAWGREEISLPITYSVNFSCGKKKRRKMNLNLKGGEFFFGFLFFFFFSFRKFNVPGANDFQTSNVKNGARIL